MIKTSFLILIGLTILSCNKPDFILQDKDFTNGEWLLVNDIDTAVLLIDDEKFLNENKNGLWVTPFGDCKWTTCDGILKLYKNGKLVSEKGYLSRTTLYESSEIIKAYKRGTHFTIEPKDKIDFDNKWDSLNAANTYPTIYHTQPEDKDIFWVYKFD